MHMADALLSPTVGLTMWTATAGLLALAARAVQRRDDDRLVPLMGVLGAFVFAAQMVNFAIPATGSSGHLGGGLLLAILLGPSAAFVVVASILTIQALFFADGGLLALGANIFNLGFLPCFLAYPLIYRPIAGDGSSRARVVAAAVIAAVVGLQLGAIGVVLQTVLSGVTSLTFASFAALMLPIHLAIGIVEGTATAIVILFVLRTRPDLLAMPARDGYGPAGRVLAAFAAAALLTGGVLAWFASTHPDGLEWSVEHASAKHATSAVLSAEVGLKNWLQRVQERTSLLPDYDFTAPATPADPASEPAWPDVKLGTSVSGIVGGVATMVLVLAVGAILRRLRRESGARVD